MLDIHCITLGDITSSDTYTVIQKQCSEFNIPLHTISGYRGHIGRGRYEGFNKGTSDYIAFVDPDDILPDMAIFKEITNYMDANTDVGLVCSQETVMSKNHYIPSLSGMVDFETIHPAHASTIHHVVVMRRSIVKKYLSVLLEHERFPEMALWLTLAMNDVVLVRYNKVGYIWHRSSQSESRKIQASNNKFYQLQRKYNNFIKDIKYDSIFGRLV